MTEIESLVVRLWGKRLKPYPVDALDGVDVAPATRAFLLSVGMPRISTDSELVTLYAKPKKTRIAGESLLQIGDDFGTALCLRPGADAVWSIDRKGELPTRFVNSSIPAMLAFISLHKKRSIEMDETASEAEFQKVVDDLANEYDKLDAAALANRENYWSVILEQTRDGLI